MRFPAVLFLTVIGATLTGCTAMKVATDHNSEYDFSSIATYQWVDAPQEIRDQDDTYLNEDVQKGLNNELAARGWKQVLDPDASVQVVYYIKLKEQTEYTASGRESDSEFSGGFVYNRDSKGWGYEEREPDLNVYTVEIGTLTVLIYDSATGDRIWRGSLQTKLDRSTSIEKQQDVIRTVSRKLLNRIPAE